MTSLNRFKAPLALAVALALPLITNGCSSVADAQAAVCCTEFKAGATIDAKIGGGVQATVAAQAVADFAGIAAASIDDITAACRNMATSLDAPAADQDAAGKEPDKRKALKLWCTAAVTAIGSAKASAGGTLTVDFQPPKCEVSVSAKANCQASCSGGVKCDFKAHPPMCTGGKLSVACKGGCTASGSAEVSCTGSCTGGCTGSCTAEGGVECAGKCEGTCEAKAGGTGNGLDAQGNCQGVCKGTCKATPPKVQCKGSCGGSCDAKCQGSAMASVQCDGKCDADFEPLKCEGGKLEGGCKAEGKCEGNCDASASAKAECQPPSISVKFSGAVDANAAGKLQAVFEANLGVILAFKERLTVMASLSGTITGNADVLVDVKASCIPAIAVAAGDAILDVTASVEACGSIAGAAK